MAAMVENGSVVDFKITSKNNVRECNGKPVNLLNGKVNHENNGYVKSAPSKNGVIVSRHSFILLTTFFNSFNLGKRYVDVYFLRTRPEINAHLTFIVW